MKVLGLLKKSSTHIQETQKTYRANFSESRFARFLCPALFFKHHGWRGARRVTPIL
jgi:hypothetical protein